MLVHKRITWEVVVFQGRKIIAKDDKLLRATSLVTALDPLTLTHEIDQYLLQAHRKIKKDPRFSYPFETFNSQL